MHNFERNEWEVVIVLDTDGGSQAIYGNDKELDFLTIISLSLITSFYR